MRGGLLVVAVVALGPGAVLAQPGGPVEATVKYYDASQASRCDEVWALYSKKMQEHIRAEVERFVRQGGMARADTRPESYRCWKDRSHKRLDTRLARMQGDEATVAVAMRGRISRSRWDIPGKMTEWTEEVELVREAGAWRIDGPRPRDRKAPGSLLELGEVRVSIGPPPEAGRHQVREASAISYLPRDSLEAVLRDPKGWAMVLPSFKSIEPQGRTGPVSRARLSFAQPTTPIPVTVRLAGKPNKETVAFTSVLWDVEQELKAPVYMRGEWYLDANANGTTRVKLTIVIDPRHWPGSGKLFSGERMANALLDLEKAALASR